jgi:hypothetical protein
MLEREAIGILGVEFEAIGFAIERDAKRHGQTGAKVQGDGGNVASFSLEERDEMRGPSGL